MKHLVPSLLLLLGACSLLLPAACSDGSCSDLQNALPLMQFTTSGTATATTPTSVTVRGIGATGADSLLANNEALSELYLPLRANDTITRFEITLNNATTDTLCVRYQPIPYFAGPECGAMYVFQLNDLSITTYGIDSVERIIPVTGNVPQVALRIYLPADS